MSARGREINDAVGLRKEIDAMCRGCIVLLCSYVEAYIRELGEVALEKIVQKQVNAGRLTEKFFYNISKEFFEEVRDTRDPEQLAKKMFYFMSVDSPYWQKMAPFHRDIPASKFNKGFASPSFEKVQSYLGRFGYDNFRRDFFMALRENGPIIYNSINNLVQCRNNIAHGDPNEKRTPSDVKAIIELSILFCRTTDQVFSNWCREEICTIR